MKIRSGFISNSSSTSFVLEKRCMSDDDINQFQQRREDADRFDSIGETRSYFFGVVDYSNDFCKWLEDKNFNLIEWDGI